VTEATRVHPRLGTHVLWFQVAIVVLLTSASTLLSVRHAEQSDDRVTAQALERTETTAAAVDEFLDQRIGVLLALATAPVIVEGTEAQQDAYFARVDLEAVGFGGGFGLITLDGRMTSYANSAGPDAVVDVTQRSYYQAVAASDAPFVGEAVLFRPSENLVVPIAVPVLGVDGSMRGILVGALRLDAAGEAPLLRVLGLGMTVVDRAGQVIVEGGAIGRLRSVVDDEVYASMDGGDPGVDSDAVDLQGEHNQLVSHAPVATGGWLIVVDVPRDEAFGDARRQLLQEMGIKGLISMMALGGALIAGRRLGRAADSVARSAAVSAAQSRVLERIALRHPLDEVLDTVRTEFQALSPRSDMRRRIRGLLDAEAGDTSAATDTPLRPLEDEPQQGAVAIAAHLVQVAVEQDRSASETLRSERRYRALVEANAEAVWRYVPGLPHSETSPWWRDLTGQKPAEMDGLGWLDAVHPEDRDRTEEMWRAGISAGEPFAGTFRVRNAASDYLQLELRGVPVPSEDGTTVEWIGTYVDVTEKRRQEEALLISEERNRLALDAADLGAWDWDLVTGDVVWSPVVERHVGLAPGTFPGTIEAFRSFIHPDDRAHVRDRARLALELGQPYSAEFRLVRVDGAIRWTKTSGLVIRDSSGRPVRLLGIDVDSTQEKERQVERQLFLASVAHDLKNPIAVLKASAQLLQRRISRGLPIDTQETRTRLAIIESNAARLARRLDDLSDISQLEAGYPVDLTLAPVDLVTIATTCVEAARRATVAHNLRLEADQPTLVGSWDGSRIERVLDNLISNAIKYSPDGGDVNVRLWSDSVNALVSVADEGMGVPDTDWDAIFRFRQRGSNVGSISGSGVGLAGAARLVELAGGEISVSAGNGPGATFVVRLPLSTSEESA